MFSHPGMTKKRRLRRRLKAVASIAVAIAAGTFLACQRAASTLVEAPAEGSPPEAGPAPVTASSGIEVLDGSLVPDAALVADARIDTVAVRPRPRDAAVDVNEHRKGMPVPDNLLE
jgi:hypothetical protein